MTPVGPSGEPSVRAQRSPPTPELIIALSDLVSLKASDVGMTDLAVGPSRTAGDGFTDGAISRGERFERELVAWQPAAGEEADPNGGLLEDPTMKRAGGWGGRGGLGGRGGRGGKDAGGAWDQFAANKSMFGVETTFDESMYTTSIDRSGGGITEAEAARIAREIESQASSNIHVQEERGQRTTADYDEEDRYGAVIGTGAAAGGAHANKTTKGGATLPSKPAWGSSKVPEGVRALADREQHRSGSPPAPKPVPAPAPAPAAATTPAPKPAASAATPAVDKPAGEKPKSTLSASAKPFSLSASAAAFVPAAKKPAAPPAPAAPVGYPGFPGGMIPPAMMMGYGAPPPMGGYPPRGGFPGGGFPGGGGGRGMGGRGGANPAQAAAAAAAAAAAYGFAVPPGGRPPAPGGVPHMMGMPPATAPGGIPMPPMPAPPAAPPAAAPPADPAPDA